MRRAFPFAQRSSDRVFLLRVALFPSGCARCRKLTNLNRFEGSDYPKRLQQPHGYNNNDDQIQYALDLSVHRNVVIDEPQHDSDTDQNNNDIDNRHEGYSLACGAGSAESRAA
jgi:hypothetical protein